MKRMIRRGIPFWLGSLSLLGALAACGGEEKIVEPPAPELPVARIAGPGTLQIGASGIFDGKGSEGSGTLAYRWSLEAPEGSDSELAFVDKEKTAFTPDYGGTYLLSLVVTDEEGESEPAVHEVKVPFPAPTAALSLRPSEVKQFEEVVADGSESTDPYELPLRYNFRLSKRPSGSTSVFATEGATARFTPDYPGLYEVSLSVSNGSTESETISQRIEVEALPAQPPVAVVGKGQKVQIGKRAQLSARGSSDPNFPPLPLSYHWAFVEKPEESETELEDADTIAPSFVVDALGIYEVELVVGNGVLESEPVVAEVEGVEQANARPTVRLLLDGQSGSIFQTGTDLVILAEPKDADGDEVSLTWEAEVPDESGSELRAGANALQRRLLLDEPGDYEVSVVAFDGKLESEPATLKVMALGPHQPPVAIPGDDQELDNGSLALFDGSESTCHDPRDKESMKYTWTIEKRPHGSTSVIQNVALRPQASLLLDKKGQYTIGLVVNDGKAASAKATLDVTSKNRQPIADAGRDLNCTMKQMEPTVIFQGEEIPNPEYGACAPSGAGSKDPDGDPLRYYWSVEKQPTGGDGQFVLNADASANVQPSFLATVPGLYEILLTVRDDENASGTDTMQINLAP